MERKVKDSRRSGMYQSWPFLARLGVQSLGFLLYSGIWRSESLISSRCLENTSIYLIYSLTYSRKKGLLFCLARSLNRLEIAMKLCTSIGTRLGAQVRDFSACFGYFTKWDRNYFEISWDHFEFSLLFARGINGGYFVAAQRNFSSSVGKHLTSEGSFRTVLWWI